ncbi:MAG: M48 family metallopeptidase [Haloplanus sp.]
MNRYHVGVTAVPYTVDHEAGRTAVACSMTGEMELRVRAPADATAAAIESALDDRRTWIMDTLYGLSERPDPRLDRSFTNGEKLLWGGQHHRLQVSESTVDEPCLHFDGSRFGLRLPRDGDTSVSARRRAVLDWYADHAADVLPACAAHVADDRPLPPITVDELDRRWVRRADGALRLHWRLALAPRPVAAYVIAHALVRADHDPDEAAFWDAVGRLVSNPCSRRMWLRHNGSRLRI